MDGVLVLSLDLHWQAYRRTFLGCGREFPEDEYHRVAAGASREVVIRRVLGEVPPVDLERLMAEKEDHVRALLETEGVPIVPGVREFLRQLRERGVPTAVATSSRSPALFLAAAELGHEFDAIIDRASVEHPKPDPECYAAAAHALGVAPDRCLAIEDTATGVDAARRCGMRVIALTTSETAAQLARATAVVDGYDAIDLDAWVG